MRRIPIGRKIYEFYNAPFTKFWFNTVSIWKVLFLHDIRWKNTNILLKVYSELCFNILSFEDICITVQLINCIFTLAQTKLTLYDERFNDNILPQESKITRDLNYFF